jgi:hypothetical protein
MIKFIFDLQKVHQEKRLQPAAAFDDLKNPGWTGRCDFFRLPAFDLGHEQSSNHWASFGHLWISIFYGNFIVIL